MGGVGGARSRAAAQRWRLGGAHGPSQAGLAGVKGQLSGHRKGGLGLRPAGWGEGCADSGLQGQGPPHRLALAPDPSRRAHGRGPHSPLPRSTNRSSSVILISSIIWATRSKEVSPYTSGEKGS